MPTEKGSTPPSGMLECRLSCTLDISHLTHSEATSLFLLAQPGCTKLACDLDIGT